VVLIDQVLAAIEANGDNMSQIDDHIAAQIEQDELEVVRALRLQGGMALPRYLALFKESRSTVYMAINSGELEAYKRGSRTWLSAQSVARRNRLEHLLPKKTGSVAVSSSTLPVNVTLERGNNRRSS
jgi:hypothetical protein